MGPVDYQTLFNIAMSLISMLGGVLIKSVLDTLKEQRKDVARLTDRVHSAELLVADKFVRGDQYKRDMDVLFASLRRIEDKLDGKQDKA